MSDQIQLAENVVEADRDGGSTRVRPARTVFGAEAFLAAMRTSPGAPPFLFPAISPDLAPTTLDERPDTAVCWVAGIYALILQRQPDSVGMHSHVRALRTGTAPTEVVEAVLTSLEAVALGTSHRPDLPEVFVTGAYLAALGRAPDAAGLTAHLDALAAGTSEADLLDSLLTSDEARLQHRFPPDPTDVLHLLSQRIQTTALGTSIRPEDTAWAQAALTSGVPAKQVVRSLARRLRGFTAAGVYGALTARSHSLAAEQAAILDALRADLLRERAWQWDLHRATWRRLDRMERPGSWGAPLAAEAGDEGPDGR